MPHANGLVVGTAGDKLAAWADPRHPHPLPVSRERLHAVACRHLPDLDGLVPGGAHHEIALRHERDRIDVVIVTVHGLHAGERLVKVPQLDGHVRAAGGEQLARDVERDVLHAVGVALQCSLEVAALKVPYLAEKEKQVLKKKREKKNQSRSLETALTLMVASSLADTTRLKTGWKTTLLMGALCPVRLNFSGGLGIHSDGDRLPRVGAPSMNSFSASDSLDSSSITCDISQSTFS